MLNLSSWLSGTLKTPGQRTARIQARAAEAWQRINDKEQPPTTITFERPDSTTVTAQTLRIEYDNGASQSESDAGMAAVRKLILFGIRGHATLPDSDIKKGYTFVYLNREYKVMSVIPQLGEVQAIAEIVT